MYRKKVACLLACLLTLALALPVYGQSLPPPEEVSSVPSSSVATGQPESNSAESNSVESQPQSSGVSASAEEPAGSSAASSSSGSAAASASSSTASSASGLPQSSSGPATVESGSSSLPPAPDSLARTAGAQEGEAGVMPASFPADPAPISAIFPDNYLQIAVAAALGVSDVNTEVTAQQLGSIPHLNVDTVTDWTGVEYLTALTGVNLALSSEYDIANLAGLAAAPVLATLWCGSDKTKGDIAVLSQLEKLENVSLSGPEIYGDIAAFSVHNLVSISLSSSKVTGDISVFAGKTNLSFISLAPYIEANTLSGDISSFGACTKLQTILLISGDYTGSLSSLSGLTELTNLTISGTKITGALSALSGLNKLETIQLTTRPDYTGENTQNQMNGALEDLNLPAKTALWSLSLNGPFTGNLSVFENNPRMQQLNIASPGLSGDIASLGGCSSLLSIDLQSRGTTEGNIFGDIGDLGSLTNLRGLSVTSTDLNGRPLEDISGDIAGIKDLNNLTILSFTSPGLTGKLADLGNKQQLEWLTLYSTHVRVMPEDKALFPLLQEEAHRGYFIQPEFLPAFSKTSAVVGGGGYGGSIQLVYTAIFQGISDVYIGGNKLTPKTDYTKMAAIDNGSFFQISSAFLQSLGEGTHNYEIDFYWGGKVSGSFTLTKATEYTVTFKNYDGSVLKTQKVAEGGMAQPPAVPSRPGYYFVSWDTPLTNIRADVTITALFSQTEVSATFQDHDGRELKTERVPVGGDATAPTVPQRAGYTFTGWDKPLTGLQASTVFTAQYSINQYTVRFLDYDQTELSSQKVNHGQAAQTPAAPTRIGYDFTGWDKGFSNITADLTVTAQYRLNGGYTRISTPGDYDAAKLSQSGNILIEAANVRLYNGIINGSIVTVGDTVVLENLRISGNVSIGATNTEIRGGWIGGNLTIEKTVANGNVLVTGVVARESKVYVKGGGSNSVVFTNSVFGTVIVDKEMAAGAEPVRILATGNTLLGDVTVNTGAILETSGLTEGAKGFGTVTLSKAIPAGSRVVLRGNIENVVVDAPGITIENNATVKNITYTENAKNNPVAGGPAAQNNTPRSPQTGDSGPADGWLAVGALAAVACVLLLCGKKIQKRRSR